MTAPKAIRAAYTEIKMVKTRSVYQVVLEGPLEQMEDAIKMLGIPKPGSETWVAVAMLNETATEPKGGKLAQSAAMLCQEAGFAKWCADMLCHADPVQAIYETCGVTSRAMLDHNADAASAFREMKSNYEFWLRDAA